MRKAKALEEHLAGGVVPDNTLTLERFLNGWLDTVVAARVGAERTVDDYRGALKHVIKGLGPVPVIKLTPEAVDQLLKAKADAGLSRSYVGRMRQLLSDALSHAQHRGLVVRNVAALSVMPKCEPSKVRESFTTGDVRKLLKAAEGHRLEALFRTGLALGLRPGELTGLLWVDLELDATPPTLAITGSMKRAPDGRLFRGPVKRSTGGERVLALPVSVVVALREHRRRQAAERLALGEIWTDAGLIFCSDVGTPIDPSNLRHVFTRIAKKASLAGFPYLMRHSAVSLLLDGGASIDEVADLTGDDPVTLYRHYRHRVRPVATVAAERFQQIIG
jgi:integrase